MNNKKHYNYNLQKISKYQEYQNKRKTKKILIAEPEPDIQYIYSLFTRQYGFEESNVNIVESGNKCLEVLFSGNVDSNNDYDIIIIDTHLHDISGFEVAKKIRNNLPNKRIVLTTTYSSNSISNLIDSIGIKPKDVFLKPFNFDELIKAIVE